MSLFSEFGWKSWTSIVFFSCFGWKAEILLLDLMIINGITRWKTNLSRNRIREEKIFQLHVRQAFFHQVDSGLVVFPVFYQGSWCILTLQWWFTGWHWTYIWNSNILEILKSPNILWQLSDHIFNGWNFISKCMVLLENSVFFLPKRLEKDNFFLKIWLEFQIQISGHPV